MVCGLCKGKCCRDEMNYRVVHMGSEFYEHECTDCEDGTLPDKVIVQGGCWSLVQRYSRVGNLRLRSITTSSSIDMGFRLSRYISQLSQIVEEL